MTFIADKTPLRGIIPPLVTPLVARDALDVAGLERLVEHVLTGGASGLFLLGTTGEGAALSDPLRQELVRRTIRQTAGRAAVLVHVTDTQFTASIETARCAADAGADAVVVSAPYYVPLEQQELAAYVRMVLDEQPLPVFLYNMPLTRTCYEPETVLRLAQIDRVVGLKDSSGDLQYLQGLQGRVGRTDWSFFVGPERLLPEAVRGGAHGCVGGGANLYPTRYVALYHAALQGDLRRVADLRKCVEVIDRIYRLAPGIAGVIRGIKCALSCMGICDGQMAAPFRPCEESERQAVRQCLAELGLMAPPNVP